MSRVMKDSGVQWIGEIPEEWEIKPLKSILVERKEINKPIKTNFILSLTMDRGVIPYSEKGSSGNKSKDDLTQYKIAYPNDIVLNSMNVIVGSVGLSKYLGAVSPAYYMLHIRNTNDSINYYNNIFQSKQFQEALIGYGNGIMMKQSESSGKLNTIRMRIPMCKLNTVIFPHPSGEEQQKIANFLDKKTQQIENIIKKQNELIENLKIYKQSLITETVTKGLNSNVKMKDSGIAWIGEIPDTWNIKKLKYMFKIKKVLIFEEDRDVLSVTQRGLKIKDTSTNEGQIARSYAGYQEVEINDFVMNHMDLLTGYVDCSKFNGVTSPDYRVFKIFDDENNDRNYYLRIFQMCYKNKIFYGLGQGVSNLGRWRLQTDKFINFILPVPPLEEQQQIASFLDKKCKAIDDSITKKQELIEKLEIYKKSLIYECVTGKREVK